MAMDKNILAVFNKEFKGEAKITRISEDLRGKVIVLYGGNNVGKTLQSARFPNPVFLPCEKGMNAINGALVLKTTSWNDLKKNGRKLASKKFTKLLKEGNQITVVVDGIERIGNYVKDYLCSKYDVATIGKANGGYGAWEEYENLVWSWVDSIISLGYTVVFIGHERYEAKKDKYVITGDERAIKPIRDNADVVAYLRSNGLDEEDKPIYSSAYLAESDEFFARTRYSYMDTFVKEFTAESLTDAIVEGIKRQNEAEGFSGVSFEEQQEIYDDGDEDIDDIKEAIKELYEKLDGLDRLEEYGDVVSEHLGDEMKVSEATEKQIESLKCIRDDLQEKIEELEEDED